MIAHRADGLGSCRRHGIERAMSGRLVNPESGHLVRCVLADPHGGDLPSLEDRARLRAQLRERRQEVALGVRESLELSLATVRDRGGEHVARGRDLVAGIIHRRRDLFGELAGAVPQRHGALNSSFQERAPVRGDHVLDLLADRVVRRIERLLGGLAVTSAQLDVRVSQRIPSGEVELVVDAVGARRDHRTVETNRCGDAVSLHVRGLPVGVADRFRVAESTRDRGSIRACESDLSTLGVAYRFAGLHERPADASFSRCDVREQLAMGSGRGLLEQGSLRRRRRENRIPLIGPRAVDSGLRCRKLTRASRESRRW